MLLLIDCCLLAPAAGTGHPFMARGMARYLDWIEPMKVNVFARTKGADRDFILAVPADSEGKAPPVLHKHWRYIATVETSDAMFRSVKVDEEISALGYCVFSP